MPDYTPIYYPEIVFGGFTNVDSSVSFFLRVRSLLRPDSVVLDVGCGRGKVKVEDPVAVRRDLFTLRGACLKVIGIDVGSEGEKNPLIDEFRLITDTSHWPIESGSIDLLVADWVIEHLDDPDAFFAECNRVLKPGGYLCFRTPNLLSYFGIISWLTPNRFHARIASTAQGGREEKDVFPTRYRCNTRGKLRRTLRRHGFQACVLSIESEPTYFSFSRFLYWLAVLHQRLAPRWFKITLLVFAKKTAFQLPAG